MPDRQKDGYGVSSRMIETWCDDGLDLLVTVDTGAAAAAEIDLARGLGLDVIVLDHHIFEERPAATALVNPERSLAAVKPSSVRKRMKKKDFARSVSRERIRECERIGIELDEFLTLSVEAMRGISDDLGL